MFHHTKKVEIKEVLDKIDDYAKEILKNKIFVYPTDTVYGIGGNALDKGVAKKIREIKKRDHKKPMSVIAPSFEWIIQHFDISLPILRVYFPGPYTLILKKRDPSFLDHIAEGEYVGVRIPDHEITLLISRANVPFITTSANHSGDPPAGTPSQINEEIIKKADYFIIGKCKLGKPSMILNPYSKEVLRK